MNIINNNTNKNNTIILDSKYQTKKWRLNQKWYINGKKNECEKYQLQLLYQITNYICNKTYMRFNIDDLSFNDIKYPNILQNGYEYTENLDVYQFIKNKKLYYNLKFICDKGGSQTRSLREVYHFIIYQLNYLLYNKDTIFINILDGDESNRNIEKYYYLIKKNKYKDVQNNVFVGDMFKFQKWFISFNK